jgi:16S rRNA processing protein RimM
MSDSSRRVVMARIVAPHGIRGWLKVQSYADPPEKVMELRDWSLRLPGGATQQRRLRDATWDGRWLRVALEGVDDRNAAEALRDAELTVPRASLPPTGEREYYWDDLLGFTVINDAGAELGTVQYFLNAPANDVMVVRAAGAQAREHWIAVTPQHLRRVSLVERRVYVDWPES